MASDYVNQNLVYISADLLNKLRESYPQHRDLARIAALPRPEAKALLDGTKQKVSYAVLTRLYRAAKGHDTLSLANRVKLIMSRQAARDSFARLALCIQKAICASLALWPTQDQRRSAYRFSETHKPLLDAVDALRAAGKALWRVYLANPEYASVLFPGSEFVDAWKEQAEKVPRKKKQSMRISTWVPFNYYSANEDLAPTRAHEDDAGWDIPMSDDEVTIEPQHSVVVNTGLRFSIPPYHVGLLKSRSGLATKYFVEVGAGVIDAGYRGEIKVLLHNHGPEPVTLKRGDRVAQLVIARIYAGECYKALSAEALGTTKRDKAGFGSTGLSSGGK